MRPNTYRVDGPHAGVPEPHVGRRAEPAPTRDHAWLVQRLTECVDGSLAAAVFVLPFVMGGRHPLGQLTFVMIAVLACTFWCLRQFFASDGKWTFSGGVLLWAGGVALVGGQLASLPAPLLERISPNMTQILPMWFGGESDDLGQWATLSFAPDSTKAAWLLLIAGGLILAVALQRLRRIEDVERLIRWIAYSTVAMALFGIVQSVTSNGRFFWLYEHPYDTVGLRVGGPFTNENHFSHFITLGLGCVVWCLITRLASTDANRIEAREQESARRRMKRSSHRRASGSRRSRRSGSKRHNQANAAPRRERLVVGLWGIAVAICVFAALMSLSRGGAISMALAMSACLAILYRGRLLSAKPAIGISLVGVFIAAGLSVHGYDILAERFGTFDELQHDSAARMAIWKSDMHGALDYPIAGTGLGTHADAYPLYFENDNERIEYTHGENGYIQVALECGLIGLALAVMAIGACCGWCLDAMQATKDPRVYACIAAIAPAFVASAVHSLCDFVWYVPGCMVLVVLFAAAAYRLSRFEQPGHSDSPTTAPIMRTPDDTTKRPIMTLTVPVPRLAAVGLLTAIALYACVALPYFVNVTQAEAAWNDSVFSRRLALAEDDPASRARLIEAMIDDLHEVERRHPRRNRLHARLSAAYQELFALRQAESDMPFSITELRETVRDNQYESTADANAWLKQVTGERWPLLEQAYAHARASALHEPLKGESYRYLSETYFIAEVPNWNRERAFLEQAVATRPHRGSAHFALGRHIAIREGLDAALPRWKTAFHSDDTAAKQVLGMVAPAMPMERIVREFRPSIDEQRIMLRFYRDHRDEIIWGRQLAGDATPEQIDFELKCLQAHCAGMCRAKAEQTQDADERFELLLSAAYSYAQLQRHEERFEILDSALTLQPLNYDARYRIGCCALELSRFEEAERHLAWCIRARPTDARVEKRLEEAISGQLAMRTDVSSLPPIGESSARPSASTTRR